jgi:hypothetical protein
MRDGGIMVNISETTGASSPLLLPLWLYPVPDGSVSGGSISVDAPGSPVSAGCASSLLSKRKNNKLLCQVVIKSNQVKKLKENLLLFFSNLLRVLLLWNNSKFMHYY